MTTALTLTLPTLTLPPGWRCTADAELGILLTALAPCPGTSGVVPAIRLELEPVTGSWNQWVTGTERGLAERVPGFVLEVTRAGYRRFGHRRGLRRIVTEQWLWAVDGLGLTLSGSCAERDHAAHTACFAAVAASARPGVSSPGSGHPAAGRW